MNSLQHSVLLDDAEGGPEGYFIGEPMTVAERVAVPSLWGAARPLTPTQTRTPTPTPTRPLARDA